jgi:hypothetical protein
MLCLWINQWKIAYASFDSKRRLIDKTSMAPSRQIFILTVFYFFGLYFSVTVVLHVYDLIYSSMR